MNHYDKDGTPLTLEQWGAKKYGSDYKRITETTLADGKWVSTVWLGIDHGFVADAQPIIFETIIFESENDLNEIDIERYATEAEAREGHKAMVARYA